MNAENKGPNSIQPPLSDAARGCAAMPGYKWMIVLWLANCAVQALAANWTALFNALGVIWFIFVYEKLDKIRMRHRPNYGAAENLN